MAWRIEYAAAARARLGRLDRDTGRRIVRCMDERVATLKDPRSIGQPLTGPMGGLSRYRVGDCRVICEISDDALRVLVVRVGRRDRVYR